MKFGKLFAGVAAAAVMLGGFALVASSANAVDGVTVDGNGVVTGPKASFTFTAETSAQLEAADLTAYKIADYVQYGTGADVAYGVSSAADNKQTVDSALKTVLKDTTDPSLPTADNVDLLAWALQHGKLDASAARPWADGATRKLAEALAGKLKDMTPAQSDITFANPESVDGGSSDAQFRGTVDLEPGIYLFVDNADGGKVTVSVPMIVASGAVKDGVLTDPSQGGTVNLKNTANGAPSKTADKSSASIGDTITYTLTGTIANPAPASFEFVDTPGVGLTVNLDSIEVKVGEGEDAVNATASDYSIVPALTDGDDTLKGNGKDAFTVTIKDPSKYAGRKITVTYTARVNSDASGDGLVNTLGNNGHTVESTVKMHDIEFTKQDKDGAKLQGAGFELTVAKDQTGSLPNGKMTAVSGEDGVVRFAGLKAGTYTVSEIQAPAGYLQNPLPSFTVTICEDGVVSFGEDAWGRVDTATKSVTNVKSVTQLPLTGAAGTVLFTVIAVLIAGAAMTVGLKARSAKRALMS